MMRVQQTDSRYTMTQDPVLDAKMRILASWSGSKTKAGGLRYGINSLVSDEDARASGLAPHIFGPPDPAPLAHLADTRESDEDDEPDALEELPLEEPDDEGEEPGFVLIEDKDDEFNEDDEPDEVNPFEEDDLEEPEEETAAPTLAEVEAAKLFFEIEAQIPGLEAEAEQLYKQSADNRAFLVRLLPLLCAVLPGGVQDVHDLKAQQSPTRDKCADGMWWVSTLKKYIKNRQMIH